jgi:hypothetical protein
MVSGKVTSDTEMECEVAESSSTTMQRDDQGGDHGDQGDNNDQAENNNDENAENNNDENGEQEAQDCSSANLQPGTVVRAAELKLSGAGATWDKVDLVISQASSDENEANENEGNNS